jgi:phosphotransferase system HPr (HPr) family protein
MEAHVCQQVSVVIKDKTGFHTRTAAAFAKRAAGYSASISVTYRDKKAANGKSMLSLMALGVRNGEAISISAEGSDAPQALAALAELVEKDFQTSP